MELIKRAKKHKRPIENYMKVIPVHFSRDSRQMLAHTKMLLERGEIRVHPKFDKLITALRAAFGYCDRNLYTNPIGQIYAIVGTGGSHDKPC
jgi:hypothetical protein